MNHGIHPNVATVVNIATARIFNTRHRGGLQDGHPPHEFSAVVPSGTLSTVLILAPLVLPHRSPVSRIEVVRVISIMPTTVILQFFRAETVRQLRTTDRGGRRRE